jgi:microcystin-dependent protein
MSAAGVNAGGGSQPHENCQPFLCINFIISLFGGFPPDLTRDPAMADPFRSRNPRLPVQLRPTGWAFCDGQLMPISQNTALFSLLGTTTAATASRTSRLPGPPGQRADAPRAGQGLSLRDLGEIGGVERDPAGQRDSAHTHTSCGQCRG